MEVRGAKWNFGWECVPKCNLGTRAESTPERRVGWGSSPGLKVRGDFETRAEHSPALQCWVGARCLPQVPAGRKRRRGGSAVPAGLCRAAGAGFPSPKGLGYFQWRMFAIAIGDRGTWRGAFAIAIGDREMQRRTFPGAIGDREMGQGIFPGAIGNWGMRQGIFPGAIGNWGM